MHRHLALLSLLAALLVGCSTEWEDSRVFEEDFVVPAIGDQAPDEPEPGAGEISQFLDSDALLDGVVVTPIAPAQSGWLHVAGEPDVVVEVRSEAAGTWGTWAPATFTEDLGWHRNGPLALDGPVDAIELRADGPIEFLQVELFETEEPWFDDDGHPGPVDEADEGDAESAQAGAGLDEDGLPEPGQDQEQGPEAFAIDGRWLMPGWVWEIAEQWYVGYEDAYSCAGRLTDGAQELGQFLVEYFEGASSYGGYDCRNKVGAPGLSVHSTGRAIDVFVPLDGGQADNTLGDPIANYLAENAEWIGIQYVIWDRSDWYGATSANKHREYTGGHPHHDHLHIELTSAAGDKQTPFFTEGPLAPSGHSANGVIDLAPTPSGDGYWTVTVDGVVSAHGAAEHHGDASDIDLVAAVWGIASTPTGDGYWLVALDGGVFAFGDAVAVGSMGGQHLVAPVVDLAPTPSGQGYWLTAMDGGVFTFGDAGFFGSAADIDLAAPVVAIAPTPSGQGYWLAATDGGVFSFGDAEFYGSMGGQYMVASVEDMAAHPSGEGYWLVGADGGVFTFGAASFEGSMADADLVAPVAGISSTPSGEGYWQVALDGGVFTFGDADFHGCDTD